MSRFPTAPYALGWWQIGYPDEFPVGAAVPLEYFGRQLVAWRDNTRSLFVADAHCPHLGAHLGYGGTVIENGIQCPFHGWQFRSDGRCALVPYSTRRPPRVGLRMYPACEVNGLTLMWFHPSADVAPLWEVPTLPEYQEVDNAFLRYARDVNTHWQEAGENSVDTAHFPVVHGTGEVFACSVEEAEYYRRITMSLTFPTETEDIGGEVTTESFGPGVVVVRFNVLVRLTLVSSAIPIDSGRVRVRFSVFVPPKETASKDRLITRLFARDLIRQVEQDSVIWEHKIYRERPCLVTKDGPIMQWRRWAERFACHGDKT